MHFSYGRNPDFCLSVTHRTDMECVRPAGRPSIQNGASIGMPVCAFTSAPSIERTVPPVTTFLTTGQGNDTAAHNLDSGRVPTVEFPQPQRPRREPELTSSDPEGRCAEDASLTPEGYSQADYATRPW